MIKSYQNCRLKSCRSGQVSVRTVFFIVSAVLLTIVFGALVKLFSLPEERQVVFVEAQVVPAPFEFAEPSWKRLVRLKEKFLPTEKIKEVHHEGEDMWESFVKPEFIRRVSFNVMLDKSSPFITADDVETWVNKHEAQAIEILRSLKKYAVR